MKRKKTTDLPPVVSGVLTLYAYLFAAGVGVVILMGLSGFIAG